jgi:polyphosphate kinase 2 (PPK2 family)
LLHISPEEQRARLQERIDDPAKNWKFAIGDIDVRKQWADYRKAYNALLRETSTDYAPWTVVPANSKTHRNLMIATIVRDRLVGLKLRYPPADPKLVGIKIA